MVGEIAGDSENKYSDAATLYGWSHIHEDTGIVSQRQFKLRRVLQSAIFTESASLGTGIESDIYRDIEAEHDGERQF